METATNTATSGARPTTPIDKTAATAHQTVDRIAEAAAPVVDRLATTAHQTVDRLAKKAAPAAQWLEQNTQKLRENANRLRQSPVQMFEDAKQCVRDHPLATLAAAIAVGVIIASISRSRS